jgi:hypothetical protein
MIKNRSKMESKVVDVAVVKTGEIIGEEYLLNKTKVFEYDVVSDFSETVVWEMHRDEYLRRYKFVRGNEEHMKNICKRRRQMHICKIVEHI